MKPSLQNASRRKKLADEVLPLLKSRLRAMPHATYEEKKHLTRWCNAELARLGLAVRCPVSQTEALLLAGVVRKTRSNFIVMHHDEARNEVRSFATQKLETLLERLSLIPADPTMGRWGRYLKSAKISSPPPPA